jgi:hypothetical protein
LPDLHQLADVLHLRSVSQAQELSDPTPLLKAVHPAAAARPACVPNPEEVEASKRRMAMIVAYLQDPEGAPVFKDRTVMFRVVTEERTYQQAQIRRLLTWQESMPPGEVPTECRIAVGERLKKGREVQSELYHLLQDISGVHNRGGTDFLPRLEASGAPMRPGRPPAHFFGQA